MKNIFERQVFEKRKRNILKSKRRKERKRQMKELLSQGNIISQETKKDVQPLSIENAPTQSLQ
jgi:hypothetical protein